MIFEKKFAINKDGSYIDFIHKDDITVTDESVKGLHSHKKTELFLCIAGDCDYIVENGRFKLQSGMLIINRPMKLHSIKINGNCRYNRFCIRISRDYFSSLFSGEEDPLKFTDSDTNSIIFNDEEYNKISDILYETEFALSENNQLEAFSNIIKLCSLFAAGNNKNNSLNLLNPLVNEAISYIHKNIHDIKTAKDISAYLNVSEAHLSRVFKKNMKTTLTNYLKHIKTENACRLLREGMSVSDVCFNCGYGDYSYFISDFKKRMGITPLRYQQLRK